MNWIDNGVTRFLGRIADFMFLNILWIVCSIPIITIGASTTAMYSVMLKLVKNEEGYIVKGFLKAFKENFKQSTIMWLLYLVLGILIVVDFRLVWVMNSSIRNVMQVFLTIMSIFLISMGIYGFSLQARYENTIKNTLKNAMILTIASAIHIVDVGHYNRSDHCNIAHSSDVVIRNFDLADDRCFRGGMAGFSAFAKSIPYF